MNTKKVVNELLNMANYSFLILSNMDKNLKTESEKNLTTTLVMCYLMQICPLLIENKKEILLLEPTSKTLLDMCESALKEYAKKLDKKESENIQG